MSLQDRIAQRLRTNSIRTLQGLGIPPKSLAALAGGTKLAPQAAADLELMRKENQASGQPFKASPIWMDLARQFDAWFAFEGIAEVERQDMNAFFSSPFPGNPKLLRYACYLLYKNLKARDSYGVLGRVCASMTDTTSGLAFEFDGNTYTWDYLISVDSFYAMVEANPRIVQDPVVFAELGAGWGRIGHILKNVNPELTYVVFDLPEVLLVSSNHLPKRLPREKVLGYRASRALTNIRRKDLNGHGLVFLGAHDLKKCEDGLFDFFVNIASFQEMTKPQVTSYFEIVDRVLRGTLYTQQLWSSGTHGYGVGEIGGFEEYPFAKHWKKEFLRETTWSDLYFEAAYSVHSPSAS